jgi:2-iminobutanoate/2-iminopropanoate deaminase
MTSGKRGIQPEGLFAAEPLGFSQGVVVGGVLHVSGQVSRASGLAAQVAEAWSSVVTVVEAAGGSAADIAKLTVYTRDETAWTHLQPLVEAAMPPPYPAATMVTVVGLASPDFLVEIEALAHVTGATR